MHSSGPNEHISQFVRELREIAIAQNSVIKTMYNDIPITVTKNTNILEAVQLYSNKLKMATHSEKTKIFLSYGQLVGCNISEAISYMKTLAEQYDAIVKASFNGVNLTIDEDSIETEVQDGYQTRLREISKIQQNYPEVSLLWYRRDESGTVVNVDLDVTRPIFYCDNGYTFEVIIAERIVEFTMPESFLKNSQPYIVENGYLVYASFVENFSEH
jgi:hypothetical protein